MNSSDYRPRGLFKNGHINTLFTHLYRNAPKITYTRERINNQSNFSLYLDWVKSSSKNLLILTHGLESNSSASYIRSMAHEFLQKNFDILAWNCLGCAIGEKIEKNSYYHSGVSNDLGSVIDHVIEKNEYENIILIGYSMGGNIMLKYLGEKHTYHSSKIKGAMAISTPVDLVSSSISLTKRSNFIYTKNFLNSIHKKIKENRIDLEELNLDIEAILQAKNLSEFDHLFTAPVHGFKSGLDYYESSSSIQKLVDIKVPTLLLNALDDPFLGAKCYPDEAQIANNNITTLYPKYGGHVGFYTSKKEQVGWVEKQALSFFNFF
jgi:predicted alpha/beta-fold hydrolase